MREIKEDLEIAMDELSEVIADFDVGDCELLEIRNIIKERIELAQTHLINIANFYKL